MLSVSAEIFLFDISDLLKPRFLGKYNVGIVCSDHGMACIEMNNRIDKINDNSLNGFSFKVLLFGGTNTYQNTFTEVSFIIKDMIVINHKNIIINNYTSDSARDMYIHCSSFGFNTIINSKNERIIITFGGYNSHHTKSVTIYNCNTKKLIVKTNVCTLCIHMC